jgi:GNAT superfamily N-acetyltransferase
VVNVIEVRLAYEDDAEQVAAVLLIAFREFEPQYTPQGFAATTPTAIEIAQRMEEGPIWLALENGQAVGTVSAVLKTNSLYIRGMAVVSSARGRGVAERLFERLDEYARANGCSRQFLSTTPFLTAAIKFYEGRGFKRTAAYGPHDLFGTPLVTMERRLLSEE